MNPNWSAAQRKAPGGTALTRECSRSDRTQWCWREVAGSGAATGGARHSRDAESDLDTSRAWRMPDIRQPVAQRTTVAGSQPVEKTWETAVSADESLSANRAGSVFMPRRSKVRACKKIHHR